MLRHVPGGRAHPYERDPDQRIPFRPVAGERLELRVTAPVAIESVTVQLGGEGEQSAIAAAVRGAAVPDDEPRFGIRPEAASEGHLSDSTAHQADGRSSWSVVLDAAAAGSRLRYRFRAGDSETDWYACTVAGWQPAPNAVSVTAPETLVDRVVPRSAELLTDGARAYRARFALRLDAGERVVGFGERFNALDQRGRLLDTAVYDQYKAQGARSYAPAPFALVVGESPFGFHVDTGRRCFFDVGASEPERLCVEVDLEPGIALDEEISLRLFAGDPRTIIRAFSESTVPALAAPPAWIYRLWLSGNEWNSERRLRHELACAEEAGIPVGVVVIEAWSDEQTFVAFNGAEYAVHDDGAPHALSDFHFPADGPWPDPKSLVDDLHGAEIKVLLWQIPLIASDEGQAGADKKLMADRGYCVKRADGSPYRNLGGWFKDAFLIDFTNPDASGWWLAKRRYLVDEVGVDGFKTDGGEHAWGNDLVYADGTLGGESNNRYPVHYQAAYHRLLRESGRPSVTFSRAAFTGSGGYPAHWAGDEDSTWDAFRASITAGLSAAVSGIFFWGWDLGGFSGPLPSVELYLRATAMAALCPIMQLHSEFNFYRLPSRDRTPWNIAEQTGDPSVIPVFRQFVQLRERLVPYLVAAGERAASERIPPMRPLFVDYPDDATVWETPFQYLLGDALLVAPVCEEGASTWTVYLPRGEWVDVATGAELTGGQTIAVEAPLESIPVFCAAEHAPRLQPLFVPDPALTEVT